MRLFKSTMLLLGLVMIASTFEHALPETMQKSKKRYRTPEEVIRILDNITMQIDKAKSKIKVKGVESDKSH